MIDQPRCERRPVLSSTQGAGGKDERYGCARAEASRHAWPAPGRAIPPWRMSLRAKTRSTVSAIALATAEPDAGDAVPKDGSNKFSPKARMNFRPTGTGPGPCYKTISEFSSYRGIGSTVYTCCPGTWVCSGAWVCAGWGGGVWTGGAAG
jgi:hypothetical protein